mmetsp:Transcript_18056/g.25978  ORF Transcript_18056/g.25978 Transcript_18056/m.25978 type:complete len:109 (-) Transcript_18056:7-333(-)
MDPRQRLVGKNHIAQHHRHDLTEGRHRNSHYATGRLNQIRVGQDGGRQTQTDQCQIQNQTGEAQTNLNNIDELMAGIGEVETDQPRDYTDQPNSVHIDHQLKCCKTAI